MKFCRYISSAAFSVDVAASFYGILDGDHIQQISAPPWTEWIQTQHSAPLAAVKLLAPVEPRKIVCVGRNYSAHAAELGNDVPKEPLIFLKPSTSIIGPSEAIVLPKYSERVEHEAELGLVIGRRCSHLTDDDDALSYVLGYTCVNDVTARDLQKTDVQFTRAKGFDTFCPVGPHIETDVSPDDLLVEGLVNGQTRQSGNTSQMVFPPAFLVRWISRMMTLEPGDLIATGTPSGVGPLVGNDVVEVHIAGIGVLRNPVQPAKP
jgi:2-keto-4-pentenoate hydratase/2-oxohepta-3-ene-1,7-dioic acid hydratase in catechol pathway